MCCCRTLSATIRKAARCNNGEYMVFSLADPGGVVCAAIKIEQFWVARCDQVVTSLLIVKNIVSYFYFMPTFSTVKEHFLDYCSLHILIDFNAVVRRIPIFETR